MPKKAVMAEGGLAKALQRLVEKGEWDKAHVERFRARVRDHLRGERAPDEKAKAAKATTVDDEKVSKKRRKPDD